MKSTVQKQKAKAVNKGSSRVERGGQELEMEKVTRDQKGKNSAQGMLQLLPRVIRLKDASGYLGMDRNRFNTEVRPGLVAIPIGTQGIGFDRYDLDAWFDEYKIRNGRPGQLLRGNDPWDVKKFQGSSNEARPGTSTKLSQGGEFARALEQIHSKKPKGS